MALVVKSLPVNAGDLKRLRFDPGLGRFPRGHCKLLQYSCLENSMVRGAWLGPITSQRVGHD